MMTAFDLDLFDGNVKFGRICTFEITDSFNGKQGTKLGKFMLVKKRTQGCCLSLSCGYIRMYVYDHYSQPCSYLKPLGRCQILYGASSGKGDKILYEWSWSHVQGGRHAHIPVQMTNDDLPSTNTK